MASLNLLAMLQAQGSGLQNAEQELASTLSPDEFRTFRDALVATGRTFRDLVKVGAFGRCRPAQLPPLWLPVLWGREHWQWLFDWIIGVFCVNRGKRPRSGFRRGHERLLGGGGAAVAHLTGGHSDILSTAQNTFYRGKAKYSTPSAGFKRERAYSGDVDETD